MKKTSVELEIAGKTLSLQVGELAQQATSSVLARLGDTMVLVCVVEGKEREDIDYFPLTVEYVERLYAGGRIKGSRWVKREGRPSDESIQIGRLIDRSIRPLFPKEFKKEVQVVVTVLSVDGENEPDILSLIATSAALAISKIPWNGPIAAVRVGFVKEDGNGKSEYLINPGVAESEFSELNLIMSQVKDKSLMIEADGLEVAEDVLVEGVKKASEQNQKIIALIEKFAKEVGEKKETVSQNPKLHEQIQTIEKNYKEEVLALIPKRANKEAGYSDIEDLINRIFDDAKTKNPEEEIDKKTINKALEMVLFKCIREDILKKGKRPDGRKIDEVRQISGKVSVLPRTHGSAVFQRGDTQALTVATLGSPRLEQLIESAEGEEAKRYIHHYSMPPYSVGETGRMGTPSRREIGHGALAEKAIMAVVPKQDVFPYTIRVVSEILSSNGSTSMAATCGSTLALMDAGVPIKEPVAGIAMGMVSSEEKYVILTDILGLEDFSGDMDFKVAGTKNGITAIQLDVKNQGLTIKQIEETLEKAKVARLFVLEKMLSVLPKSREEVSAFAPKIELIQIPVDKIGELIGPGGKTIKNIIAQTGATVDVDDDGKVAISSNSEEVVQKAVDWVKGLTREVAVGEVFEGEVKRILPFGAFVEFLPGKEGMVHVSKISDEFVKDPGDVLAIGQKVKVKVAEIDEQGRINLTMKFGENVRENASGQGPRPEKKLHPLSMQLRRERATSSSDWRNKGKQRYSSSNFRKDRY